MQGAIVPGTEAYEQLSAEERALGPRPNNKNLVKFQPGEGKVVEEFSGQVRIGHPLLGGDRGRGHRADRCLHRVRHCDRRSSRLPPVAAVPLPWDGPVADPVAGARRCPGRACGDTFIDASGRYLFLFSPAGVRSFYALPEERASKGVADFTMLRRKVPDELFAGRRTLPHELFGRDDVASYLDEPRLGARRRRGRARPARRARRVRPRPPTRSPTRPRLLGRAPLGRRRAVRPAGGRARRPRRGRRLRPPRPDGRGRPVDDKAAEQPALADATVALGETLDEHDRDRGRGTTTCSAGSSPAGTASRAAVAPGRRRPRRRAAAPRVDVEPLRRARLDDRRAAGPARPGRAGAGRRPPAGRGVRAGVDPRAPALDHAAAASSQPVEVDDGIHRLAVEPGVTIATLLPLTNLTAAPGLDRWDEARWAGRRLRGRGRPPGARARHGVRPRQAHLPGPAVLAGRDHPRRDAPPRSLRPRRRPTTTREPVPAQIGGVARSADPCPVRYIARC